MIESTLLERYRKLLNTQLHERRKQFPIELNGLNRQAAAQGMLSSSRRLIQVQQCHQREFEIRANIAWNCLVRVHGIFKYPITSTVREDLKAELNDQISHIFSELNTSIFNYGNNNVSIAEARQPIIDRHDVEVDLYIDSLTNNIDKQNGSYMTHNYTFYGNVGAVQTGANSSANIIQNLSSDDRSLLESALQQVKLSIENTPTISTEQKGELLEIANECSTQLSLKSPNNTKLRSMFEILGTTIQTIASAQPAYQTLKLALLPLGIMLP